MTSFARSVQNLESAPSDDEMLNNAPRTRRRGRPDEPTREPSWRVAETSAQELWEDFQEANPVQLSPVVSVSSELRGDGRLQVVGESFYQEALEIVARGDTFEREIASHLPVRVVLVPEPENPFDDNAVRVDVSRGEASLKVGYLAREQAAQYKVPGRR